MNKFLRKTLSVATLLVLLAASVLRAQDKALVISIAENGVGDRLGAIEPLAAYLAEELNRPVKTTTAKDAVALMNQLESGEADIAYMNGFGYVLGTTKNLPLEVLVLPGNAQGQPNTYNSCLLAPRGRFASVAQAVEQASQTSLLFVNPTSTSGHLVPRLYLSSLGVKQAEISFAQVLFGQNHYLTLNKVRAGEADLAAMAYNIYQTELQKGNLKADELDVLWVSEGIPSEPVVVNKNLDSATKQAVRDAFLQMHQRSPVTWAHVQQNFSARQATNFVAGKDEHYDSIRNTSGKIEDLLFILNFYIN